MARNAVNSITVRLLKPKKLRLMQSAPRMGQVARASYELKGQDWDGDGDGEGIVYYGQVYDTVPEWLSLLQGFVSDQFDALHSSGSAAILFLNVEHRWMCQRVLPPISTHQPAHHQHIARSRR